MPLQRATRFPGVPVGYELARALDAPLDVLIAKRVWAPGQPELAIGAVAPGGTCCTAGSSPRSGFHPATWSVPWRS